MKLLVATSNPGKLVEIREILTGIPFELLTLEDVALPAPDEPFATFHDNAARTASAMTRSSCRMRPRAARSRNLIRHRKTA